MEQKTRLYWMIKWPTSGTSTNDSSNKQDEPHINETSTNDSGNKQDEPPAGGTSTNDSGNKKNCNSVLSSTDSGKRQGKCSLGSRYYSIVSTTDKDKASNFYLKPIVESSSDKYFWIVTDPEDHGQQKKSQKDKENDKPKWQSHSDECRPESTGSEKRKPQRYV